MSEGEVSSTKSGADDESKQGSEDSDQHTPALGDRFRAPASSAVDAGRDPGEDESVEKAADKLRSGGRLGDASVQDQESLDQQGDGGEDVDEHSILDALDGGPDEEGGQDTEAAIGQPVADEEEDDGDIPEVQVEPLADEDADHQEDDGQDEDSIVCPSCEAENPGGMRFCVQCGGSLERDEQDKGASRLQGQGATAGANKSAEADKDPPPPSEAAEQENPWDIQMVAINEDGTDGKTVPLEYLETTVGRDGDERFPTDAFLSPKHARLHIEDGQLYIEDLYSLNGTFIKLREETRLTPGDTILMGRQVLRFERFEQSITPKTTSSDGTRYMGSPAPGGNYKVLQVGIGDVIQNVYCLPEEGAVLGREKGDIVFPHDKFMSGRHAQIYPGEDGHCYLVDLNSSNGTWIKIWEKTELDDGDFIFLGQQLFRVQYDE